MAATPLVVGSHCVCCAVLWRGVVVRDVAQESTLLQDEGTEGQALRALRSQTKELLHTATTRWLKDDCGRLALETLQEKWSPQWLVPLLSCPCTETGRRLSCGRRRQSSLRPAFHWPHPCPTIARATTRH